MARPALPGVQRHLHIDPYLRVKAENASLSFAGDARLDKFLKWFDGHPAGTRTQMCLDVLIAAANGELGVAAPVMLDQGDDDAAQAALADLLSNMAMDDE